MPFNPLGDSYDDALADMLGFKRDEKAHLPSRDPRSGQMLKGLRHSTFHKAVAADLKLGFKPYFDLKTGRIFTFDRPADPSRYLELRSETLTSADPTKRKLEFADGVNF